jgi:membrane-bound serine protease (ClpP class)
MINIPLLAVSQEIYTIGILIGAIFVILLIMEIQICQLRFRVIDLEKGCSPATDKPDDLLSAEGVAITTFELSGIVNIKGNRVDVISEGEMISKNTRIKVTDVKGNRIVVKPVKHEKPKERIKDKS